MQKSYSLVGLSLLMCLLAVCKDKSNTEDQYWDDWNVEKRYDAKVTYKGAGTLVFESKLAPEDVCQKLVDDLFARDNGAWASAEGDPLCAQSVLFRQPKIFYSAKGDKRSMFNLVREADDPNRYTVSIVRDPRPEPVALTAPWSDMSLPQRALENVTESTPTRASLECLGTPQDCFKSYLGTLSRDGWSPRGPIEPSEEPTVQLSHGTNTLTLSAKHANEWARGLTIVRLEMTREQ